MCAAESQLRIFFFFLANEMMRDIYCSLWFMENCSIWKFNLEINGIRICVVGITIKNLLLVNKIIRFRNWWWMQSMFLVLVEVNDRKERKQNAWRRITLLNILETTKRLTNSLYD